MPPRFDIEKLRQDAHSRWLKPPEVLYILQKHEEFGITQVTPVQPPSGTLLLFNRRVHRFFRKDGHVWQKKKDGKCIGEAHEHLKVGNVDALNCYYARGEENPYFQRRIYWMLDLEYTHIVLVHYREVSEGRYIYKPDISPYTSTLEEDGSGYSNAKSNMWQIDSDDKSGSSSVLLDSAYSISYALPQPMKFNGKVDCRFPVPEFSSPSPSSEPFDPVKQPFQILDPDFLIGLELPQGNLITSGSDGVGCTLLGDDAFGKSMHICSLVDESKCKNPCESIAFQLDYYKETHKTEAFNGVLDSGVNFLRNEKDIGSSSEDARVYLENSGEPPLVIREVFPDKSYSSKNTKVIIIGDFPTHRPLCAMFGNIEVPLQIIQNGVLFCQVPELPPGKVELSVTSDNRESCSNIRDFECLPNPDSNFKRDPKNVTASSGELELIIRLARVLLCEYYGGEPETRTISSTTVRGKDEQWEEIIKAVAKGNESLSDSMTWVFIELLKDKLQLWLSSKKQARKNSCYFLSKDEKCVLHLISGLGFEWALASILELDICVDFRDSRGWTALHWAACFGREEMVASLVAVGASAGAVTDPTAEDPVGHTPASIAESRGHKGLAGYLAEVALTSHLSSLTIGETEDSRTRAACEAETTVQAVLEKSTHVSSDTAEDQPTLITSLAAVKNAAHAAARILAAFRALSFNMRQQKAAETCDEYGLTSEEYHHISSIHRKRKTSHDTEDQKFHEAALQIQKKYRGWKGRKSFLSLRHNVVKIQAHVRGYHVRKKYKELLRCVNIIEKIMLRWRWGRAGLRGFRPESNKPDEEVEDDDILRVFRKQKVDAALDKDFKRVLSMVGSAEARQQYNRMVNKTPQAQGVDNEQDAGIPDDEFLLSLPPLSPPPTAFSLEQSILLYDVLADSSTATASGADWFMDELWSM